MNPLLKKLAAIAAAIVMTTGVATSQEAEQKEPLTFSTLSTQSSLPAWYPTLFLFDVATVIQGNTRVLGGGGLEKVRHGTLYFTDLRGELGWPLAVGSAASSASSNPFQSVSSYLVLGAILSQASNNYFVDTGGNPFATDGRSTFRGVYTGLNFALAGQRNAASSAASSAAAILWTAFANLGWGKGEVDAFNGTFSRNDTGLFYEIGTAVQIDVGGVYFGPVLTYRHFDQSLVKREETTLGLRFTIPF